jgi:imidazole glycerol phosphate synthase glutamine amidotransferase subunit
MSPTVHILASPTANLASVAAAVHRCGGEPMLTDSPRQVETSTRLIFPGVGSFATAMSWLNSSGLAVPLLDRLRSGAPTLAICLGMQVLFDSSEESPGVRGLSVINGRVTRFEPSLACRIPQLGWNRVAAQPGFSAASPQTGFAYFANSYCANSVAANDWACATSDHGGPFIASVQHRRNPGILACQFHPELSGPGPWGLGLLRNWMATTPALQTLQEPRRPC